MRVVYKFKLEEAGKDFTLSIPEGAKFLHAEMQGNFPQAWFEVDTANKPENKYFRLFGTGEEIVTKFGKWIHHTSFQDGSFVWHLYQRVDNNP